MLSVFFHDGLTNFNVPDREKYRKGRALFACFSSSTILQPTSTAFFLQFSDDGTKKSFSSPRATDPLRLSIEDTVTGRS
jgi:hypothetical protein